MYNELTQMNILDLKHFCANLKLTDLDLKEIEAQYPHSRYVVQDYWNEHFNELKKQRKASFTPQKNQASDKKISSQINQNDSNKETEIETPKSEVQTLLQEKSFFNLNNKSIKRESMFQKRSKIERQNQTKGKSVSNFDLGMPKRILVVEEEIDSNDSLIMSREIRKTSDNDQIDSSNKIINPFMRMQTMPLKKKNKINKSQKSIRKNKIVKTNDGKTHNTLPTKKQPKKSKTKEKVRVNREKSRNKSKPKSEKGKTKTSNRIQELQKMIRGNTEKSKNKKRFKESSRKIGNKDLEFDDLGSAFKKKSSIYSNNKSERSKTPKKKKNSLGIKKTKQSAKRKSKI